MSLILDALGRRSPHADASGVPRTARGDAVLATLGYSKRPGPNGPPLKTLLLLGASAILLGFVGLALLVTVLAPPARNQDTLAQRSGAPAPPRAQAAPPRASEIARPPAAGVSEPAAKATAPDVEPADPPAPPVREAAQTTNTPSAAPAAPVRGPAALPPLPPAVNADPGLPPPQPSAASPSARSAPPPADDFERALSHQRFGEYAAASSLYSAVVTKNGPSPVVHNNEGVMFIDRGEPDGAIRKFMEALNLDPKYVKAQNNLGVAFLNAGRLDEATKALHMALTQEPRNVESMVNLALVHKAAGRHVDARELLQRAVAVEPRSAGAHYNLAVVADEAGDVAMAAEHYRAFLRLDAGQHTKLMAPVRARLNALGR